MANLVLPTVLSMIAFHVFDTQPLPGTTPPIIHGRPPRCNSSEEQACDVFQTCGVSCDSQPAKPSLYQACGISCSSPSVQRLDLVKIQVCYCDQMCTDFGDCCHDYEPSARNFTSIKHYTRCLEIDDSIIPLGSMVISRCPADFHNRNITNKCQSRTSDDIFQVLPVDGILEDGRQYCFRNIYCALCHGVNISDILQKGSFWRTAFKPKNELYPMTYEEEISLFDRTVQNLIGTAQMQALYNSDNFMMKILAPSLAHHCNVHVEPMKAECMEFCPVTTAECSSYMYFSDYFPDSGDSFVKLQFGHCPDGGWPMISCFYPSAVPSIEYTSFYHLLDFTGLGHEISTKISMPSVKCSGNRIYDKLAKKCRQLLCPRGTYLMHNGSCGHDKVNKGNPNNTYLNQTDAANSSLDLKCTMITYTDNEYDVKDDKAYVKSGLSFQPGDYFIRGNVLYVCNPFTNGSGLRFFEYNESQYKLTVSGNVISLCGLAVFLLTYALFKELRTLPGQIMINLAITLFMAQLIMLAAIDRTEIPKLCKTVAIVEHFLWLCAFFWMNSMCFSVFKTFYKLTEIQKPSPYAIYTYVLYSVLGPSMIVVTCIILEFATDVPFRYGDERRCWISGNEAILYGFALPLALIIFSNVLFIVFTIIQLIRAKRQVRRNIKNSRENKLVFLITVKLSTVMGSTWIFGYVGALTGSHVLWYLFTIFNSLQGLFMFLSYICRKKIFLKYCKLIIREKASNSSPSFPGGRKCHMTLGACSASTNCSALNDSETTKM